MQLKCFWWSIPALFATLWVVIKFLKKWLSGGRVDPPPPPHLVLAEPNVYLTHTHTHTTQQTLVTGQSGDEIECLGPLKWYLLHHRFKSVANILQGDQTTHSGYVISKLRLRDVVEPRHNWKTCDQNNVTSSSYHLTNSCCFHSPSLSIKHFSNLRQYFSASSWCPRHISEDFS